MKKWWFDHEMLDGIAVDPPTYLPQLDISAVYTDNIGQDESNPKSG